MRIRLSLPWLAFAFVAVTAPGCATVARYALEGDSGGQPARQQSWREVRDSVAAQEIADEVGPRVTVRATVDEASGSRHVEANFRMYDDAYVIVGHLDAGGRVRIVFPQGPDDDGFVRADKVYHVPSFFAGFGDEYRWRYAEYRQRAQSFTSRRDSYDGGIGYVFVVASWRPMRLDRIADGGKWQSYEVSDINYLADPREAIEELGALLAGDNREAYTIEYARYTTTNYGTFSLAALNNCYARGLTLFGFNYSRFGWFTPWQTPFPSFFGSYGGCGSRAYAYYPRFAYGYPTYTPGPPIVQPPVIRPPGPPIIRRPRSGEESGGGRPTIARRMPDAPTTQPGQNSGYRQRGLVAEDAPPIRRGIARRSPSDDDVSGQPRRPALHDMVGRGRDERGMRGGERYSDGFRSGGAESPTSGNIQRASGSYRGGTNQPRTDEGVDRSAVRTSRGYDRPSSSESGGYSPGRREPSSGSARDGGERASPPPSAPREPRAEPRAAPAPAVRPEPPAGSGERRKPGA